MFFGILMLACGGRAESEPLDCCQTSAGFRWSTGENTLTLQCNRQPLPEELPGMTCALDAPLPNGDYQCVFSE